LDAHGEFFPYAVATTDWGETKLIVGDPREGEQPTSIDVLQVLAQGLREERDTLRAAAVVSDVRLADSDAVRVECDHQEGQAFAVFLPYEKKRLRRGIEYGDLMAGSGDHQIWPSA
jgi:hypothetical protein